MHCVFSYSVQSIESEKQHQIETQITEILSHYQPYARRLSSFYIVHIRSSQEWDAMLQSLISLSNSSQGAFHFIMSPIMEGGRYNGILPRGEWVDINSITEIQD